MSEPRFYLCAIPGALWDSEGASDSQLPDIARFAGDALAIERRIAKGVNLENERTRYNLCCLRLESAVLTSGRMRELQRSEGFEQLLTAGHFPTITLDATYLDVLHHLIEDGSDARLGASFFPPDAIAPHLVQFKTLLEGRQFGDLAGLRRRVEFLEQAVAAGCGIVEMQNPFARIDTPTTSETPLDPSPSTDEEKSPGLTTITLGEDDLLATQPFSSDYKQAQIERLSHAILEAIAHGTPVNFSNQPNDTLTEVLHRLVFVPEGKPISPVPIRIVYADGSEGRPFPLRCLPAGRQAQMESVGQHPVLRATLMSMRHLDLDPVVDIAWFRNREVSRTRTLAETDEFCYHATLDHLDEALEESPWVLHLYQTGFEPAVIAFYRGVVETLRELEATERGKLAVLPRYYRGGDRYAEGSWWI